jgi:predicted phosphodiesterase
MSTMPEFSRRFAVRSALGTAALTLCPLTRRAVGAERTPLRFLVVTDTHLGYRDQDSATQQWKRTADELARAEGKFVLHLGDVVDGGREVHYPAYVDIRKSIGKAVHEIPGNHDPAELFEKYLRKPIDTVVDHDWLRILLVNNARPESHDGFLSREQLAWMDAQCAEAAKLDRFVLIAMHVPVHENRHPDRGWYVKKEHGHAEFYDLAKRHSERLLAVFHGHFHNGLRGWTDHAPVHEISFPSALYNLDRRLEEQKAPGYNPTEFRPGFSLVEITPAEIRVEFKPLGQEVTVKKQLPREGTVR